MIAGEWWNANVVDVETQALASGAQPNNSDAFTINGLPGDLYPCSQNSGPHWVPVPRQIDEHMFVTVNMGISACPTCLNGTRLSASMNNYSFVNPTSLSLLQAFYFNVSGIYTPDFPDTPPVKFDYTNDSINILNSSLCALALGISYSFRRREWTDERVYFATTSN
ncbi:MULTI-COPPER OXIDASE [Salix koriyanagi]|uniref:MULTI-COPPER OXIDASE n=1 Tax=Salix koriyanagi TaxID=2511006 RepID=A0A9Q0VG90_9ROSI|nr:MULTI-COPPER OXIDASE [Salix koriyanagi]